MRQAGFVVMGLAIFGLQGCGPDWQPSWNVNPHAALPPQESLTVRRVTGGDGAAPVLQTETMRFRVETSTPPAAPNSPGAVLQGVPNAQPDAVPSPRGSSTPPPSASVPPRASAPAAPAPAPSAAPPPARVEGRVIQTGPGQAPGIVAGGNDRVQVFNQPGTAGGGIAMQDGGTTTVISPGGRITQVPATR